MSNQAGFAATPTTPGLFALACRVLRSASPLEKVRLTREAAASWGANRYLGPSVEPPKVPARPESPKIVPVAEVPRAKGSSGLSTNVVVLHSLAHVELNAIDLSMDTLVRFASQTGQPDDFATDFLSIAVDEARHFEMLEERLRSLGSCYGALPAHDLIEVSARVSADDAARRLALGQLVQEARGLDAGPKLASRLVGTGDTASAAVVNIIADEEVRHVQLGVKWFLHLCQRANKNAVEEFHTIALEHANPGAMSPPFNEQRRSMAGLEPEWYLPVSNQIQEQIRAMRVKRASANNAT